MNSAGAFFFGRRIGRLFRCASLRAGTRRRSIRGINRAAHAFPGPLPGPPRQQPKSPRLRRYGLLFQPRDQVQPGPAAEQKSLSSKNSGFSLLRREGLCEHTNNELPHVTKFPKYQRFTPIIGNISNHKLPIS